jgi:hypothetical protein
MGMAKCIGIIVHQYIKDNGNKVFKTVMDKFIKYKVIRMLLKLLKKVNFQKDTWYNK